MEGALIVDREENLRGVNKPKEGKNEKATIVGIIEEYSFAAWLGEEKEPETPTTLI